MLFMDFLRSNCELSFTMACRYPVSLSLRGGSGRLRGRQGDPIEVTTMPTTPSPSNLFRSFL